MKKKSTSLFPFCWHDCFTTMLILSVICSLSLLLRLINDSDLFVPMLFVMAVFLIARFTTGYLFGIVSSFIGLIIVNFIFIYPRYEFNFTASGYPLTLICMLAASIITSAMTTRIREQEKIRREAEKEKMRCNLLRAVSHDLRTPLTSISGAVSALIDNKDRLSETQQHELLKESYEDAEWLIRMVENLLSITRINSDEARVIKTPEAVEEIVGEAVRKFNKRYPQALIAVAVPDNLMIVPMDAMLIEQVLINLLENAVQHGKSMNGIELTVTKSDSDAIFIVSDKGVGIKDTAWEHLFDEYTSERDESSADSKRNMGIGLSVCMSIVKAHSGAMNAGNKPEGGATFRFTLPIEEEKQCR